MRLKTEYMFCIYLQISLVHYDEAPLFRRKQTFQSRTPKGLLKTLCLKQNYLPNTASRKPAAIAEPITPATFGPIACMRRKFDGFAF